MFSILRVSARNSGTRTVCTLKFPLLQIHQNVNFFNQDNRIYPPGKAFVFSYEIFKGDPSLSGKYFSVLQFSPYPFARLLVKMPLRDRYGLVRLEYQNINGSHINLELIEVQPRP